MNAYAKAISKVWGTTTPLILGPMFEMHRLVISPMHRCSFHMHAYKHNAFYIENGLLFIDSALYAPDKRDTICLSAGDSYNIEPNVWHQFRTESAGCRALEMYYTNATGWFKRPLSEDITRHDEGCKIIGDGDVKKPEPGLWNGWRKT